MKWHIETRKISDLILNPKNPRYLKKEQADHLKKSIEKFGLCEPVVINTDNSVIGGHQRIATMKTLGHVEAEVYVPDDPLSEKDAEELTVRLNKNTGEWDFEVLANEWEPTELIDYGFTEDELSFELPKEEKTEKIKSSLGDIYQVGIHHVLCGNSTDSTEVDRLLKDDMPKFFVADPKGCDFIVKRWLETSQGSEIILNGEVIHASAIRQ